MKYIVFDCWTEDYRIGIYQNVYLINRIYVMVTLFNSIEILLDLILKYNEHANIVVLQINIT